jgi:DNA-binding GntR family transcriptional regulator
VDRVGFSEPGGLEHAGQGRLSAAKISAPAYRTKAESVYDALKEAILSGELEPGTVLRLRTLQTRFGVSITPIREALRALAQEGLVDIRAHAEARVSDLPEEALRENLLIRAELEGLAARLAVQHLTEDTLRELEGLCEEMEQCLRFGDLRQYGILNRRFHLALYAKAPYPLLYELIVHLWNRVPQARSVFALVPGYAAESQKGHRKMLEALRRRDGERLAQYVREQKLGAMEALTRRARRERPEWVSED